MNLDGLIPDNILQRLANLEARLSALERRDLSAQTLSEISDDLGSISSGEFRTQDQNGNTRMLMTGNSEATEQEFGVRGHLLGIGLNGPEFWVDADSGKISAAGGGLEIGNRGVVLSGHPINLVGFKGYDPETEQDLSIESYQIGAGGIDVSLPGDIESWGGECDRYI